MKKIKLFSILLLVLTVSFNGCKKDDNDGGQTGDDPPTPGLLDDEDIISLPAGLLASDDETAEMVVDWVESATDMTSFVDNLTPPEGATKTKSTMMQEYTWTWNYPPNVYTFIWTYDETATTYEWDLDIALNSVRFNYIDAWEAKDGKSGEVLFNFNWVCIYDEQATECEDFVYKYSWEYDNSGTLNWECAWESLDDEVEYIYRWLIISNADGSGSIEYYMADELWYQVLWDILGNGSWTYYLGTSTMTGSWTI
jgi:hypothetical protein